MVTVDGICELMGREIKIISLVPEGTHVEKGSVVCKFDASEFEKNVAEQEIKVKQAQTKVATTKEDIEIQRNEGESKVAESTVEHKLAELNVRKYKEGDYRAEIADAEGNIALNSQKREEAANKLEQTKELVKKGFRSLDQLRAVEQEHSQYKSFVERDQLKLEVKKNYEYELKTTELQSKVDHAKSKIERAKATLKSQVAKATSEFDSATATATIETNRLQEFKEQLGKTVITAEQSGVVAYANEPWYDSSRQIREGAMVYPRQKIFSLPDMTKMQVVVNIH
jgi:multidrug resistance efflux pump